MSATAFQRMRREAEAKKQIEENEPDFNKLKVAELREVLDKQGIEYDVKSKKEDLIKLLEGAE
jgi:hypothetical protein